MKVRNTFITFLFLLTVHVFGEFNLTVVHISDFHSHWYEFDENKHDCSRAESKAGKCYGGFARLLTFVRDIREREKNVLVLSSGEFFLGKSLHALHGWKLAHALLPKLELDAMSLSNRDFDSGIFDLSALLYAMDFPVLCANMIARNTSFLYSRVNKSVVLDIGDTKVGIVGYIHRHALKKSQNAVSLKFVPEIPALQEEISRLEDEGINKIIALGHAGYFTDLEIAKKVKGVDIIMGGDSDIMLFDPGDDIDELSKVGNIHGNYPRVHHQEPETTDEQNQPNRTLVLHIPQHGMYVGVLRATFDDNGKIIHESGEPVMLNSSIKQDEATLEFLEYANGALEEINQHMRLPDESEILGFLTKHLDGNRRRCRMFECSLGNFIADAMLHEFTFHHRNKTPHPSSVERWGPIDALVVNSGMILRSLEPGHITIKHIVKSVYLGDYIRRAYMSGQQVLDMMEHSVKHYDPSGVTAPGSFLQIAGLKVEYDLSQLPGRRVRSLMIRCRNCDDDNTYYPIVAHKTYIIGMPHFMHGGRDGFYNFEDAGEKDIGQFDVELIVEYLRRIYKIEPNLDGRIKFFQNDIEPNTSFNTPLIFGESAPVYNKINGTFHVPMNKEISERENNGSKSNTRNETTENIYDEKPENKNVSAVTEIQKDQNYSSFPHSLASSSTLINKSEEKNDHSLEELTELNYLHSKVDEVFRMKEKDASKLLDYLDNDNTLNIEKKTDEKDLFDLNYGDTTEISLKLENKNIKPDRKELPNLSNFLDESQKELEAYNNSLIEEKEADNNPLIEEINTFENVVGRKDKISKTNDIDEPSTKRSIRSLRVQNDDIANDAFVKNETGKLNNSGILNNTKILESMIMLLNTTPETLNLSLEKISKRFPNFPGSSDFMQVISHTDIFKKRSSEKWFGGEENKGKFYGLNKNISSFIQKFENFIKNNSSDNSTDPFAEEIKETSEGDVILKILQELQKHVSTVDDLEDNKNPIDGVDAKETMTSEEEQLK